MKMKDCVIKHKPEYIRTNILMIDREDDLTSEVPSTVADK